MKKIYIILTHTGTILSNIMRGYTKDEFSHVSIALDEELEEMYSFGRLNPYNAFVGGFIHENIKKGTFKRFKNTQAVIYSILVEDKQYEKVKKKIKKIEKNSQSYKFNVIGLFAVSMRVRIRAPRSFYCAEFVKYVLQKSGIKLDLPEIIRPEHFKNIPEKHEEYRGLLRKYNQTRKEPLNYVKDMLEIYSRKEGII